MMRQLVKRAGYVVAAVLLALVGVVTGAGTASADPLEAVTDTPLRVQGCASAGCVRDVLEIPRDSTVTTFCLRNGYNIIYTGPTTGRGGFVHRSVLVAADEGAQTAICDTADAGVFSSVGVGSTNLRPCSSANCVDIGDAFLNDLATVYCQLGNDPPGQVDNRWFLLYISDTRNAGFLPVTAMNQRPIMPSCNDV
jgi:hypothetical protein